MGATGESENLLADLRPRIDEMGGYLRHPWIGDRIAELEEEMAGRLLG